MQIRIKDNMISNALKRACDDCLYYSYSNDLLEEANIPKREDLVEIILDDPTFYSRLEKAIVQYIITEDDLYHAIIDRVRISQIHKAMKKCEYVREDFNHRSVEQESAENIKNTINSLKKLGYKITPPAK